MPPRLPFPSRFGVSNLCFRPAQAKNVALPITPVATEVTMAHRRKYKDPYALAQAKQRKDANLSRQKELQAERSIVHGDPVRGVPTPFLESFDDVGGAAATVTADVELKTEETVLLNHFLKPTELKDAIEHSHILAAPVISKIRDISDPAKEKEQMAKHLEEHARATAAITRIVSLANASSKEKTRANTVRCIETFGRHMTDKTLRPRPPVSPEMAGNHTLPEKTPRAGPDTGSSEVQIAILTAKIRVLANQLEERGGKKDKINKRNLRVMVHKRQKLLNYLRRKERGGDRWQHLVSTLGLSEATWKGEISL